MLLADYGFIFRLCQLLFYLELDLRISVIDGKAGF